MVNNHVVWVKIPKSLKLIIKYKKPTQVTSPGGWGVVNVTDLKKNNLWSRVDPTLHTRIKR